MIQSKHLRNLYIPLLLIAALTALDQWTKALAVHSLKGHEDVILINHVLQLRYIENRGAAFGILQNSRVFFIILTVIVLAGAVIIYTRYCLNNRPHVIVVLLFSVLMAGAIGNLIDRAVHGYVVDFIYFSLIDFPVFNAADIYITCGCIITLLYVLISDKTNDHTV